MVPLFLALLFVVVELGVVFSMYVGLTNSAREAARTASIYRYPDPTSLANQTFDAARQTIDDARLASINTQIATTRNPLIANPASVVVNVAYPAAATNIYRYGDKVVVTLQYQHQYFFGAFLFQAASVTLRAQSEMRLEPGGL